MSRDIIYTPLVLAANAVFWFGAREFLLLLDRLEKATGVPVI